MISLLLAGSAWVALPARADDDAVPIARQIELLVKVAGYDKNLSARAGDKVKILLLTKSGSDESTRAATQAEKALADAGDIGGLPHEQSTAAYSDASSLAKLCKSKRIAIVYVTPGFQDSEIEAIAKAFDGGDVLTATAVASFVSKGIVLGFDLVSGKPKLLVHLAQAKKQNVDLSAEVLKLMKVVA